MYQALISIFIFLFGATVGSFLNSVIYRLNSKESFIKGRSYCPSCKHKLSFFDLIPIFSFIFLLGKCRYCRKKISLQYPLVELFTGLVFILIFFKFPLSHIFSIVFYLIVSSFLIVIFVYDLKHYLILDKVIYPLIALNILYNLLFMEQGVFINSLVSALGSFLFFLLIFLISKGSWMGFGDVKLAFFIGLFLGYPNTAVALFLSFFIGAIIGLGLIILRKKTMKSEIPFGPFLVLSIFISLFFGAEIIGWYFNSIVGINIR